MPTSFQRPGMLGEAVPDVAAEGPRRIVLAEQLRHPLHRPDLFVRQRPAQVQEEDAVEIAVELLRLP